VAETIHVDKALAKRIMAGDEKAFRETFDRFFPRLYRFALVRLDHDRQATTEVVQQTFCKAIEKLSSYRGEASLYAWFHRICHNTLVDHCRRRNIRSSKVVLFEDARDPRELLEALSAPASEQPESRASYRDLGRLVQTTLDHLPDRYGDALELKYVEGLSVKEIAVHMDIGPKAVESLLTRARVAFREAFLALSGCEDALEGLMGS
jgi:RNA polymerase sigma-70 factor (ECF subfamily)